MILLLAQIYKVMPRTVSFVEKFEFDFHGNLFNQAVLLADVDNDKKSELVIGNTEGNLAIFKGSNNIPWRKSEDLGLIACIGCGCICENNKNILLVLVAEGSCYGFDIKSDLMSNEIKDGEEDNDKVLKPTFTQHLPINGRTMLITDIDGDGQCELVIGYADRVVRCFKWTVDLDGEIPTSKLSLTSKWELTAQIGSLSINTSNDNKPQLLVTQPGGTYVILHHSDAETKRNKVEVPHMQFEGRAGVSTEVIGNIGKDFKERKNSSSETYVAVCTLDGKIYFLDGEKMLWSKDIKNKLFSLTKLDITGNGTEEVVCCAWNGQTYIINHTGDVVRYQFDENVATFTAGKYYVPGQGNMPCFVYGTFNNKIYLYYNISLPRVESTNLIDVMNSLPDTHELLTKLKLSKPSNQSLRELYHWCLYGWKAKS